VITEFDCLLVKFRDGCYGEGQDYLKAVLKNYPVIQIIKQEQEHKSISIQPSYKSNISRLAMVKKDFLELSNDNLQHYTNQLIDDLKNKER